MPLILIFFFINNLINSLASSALFPDIHPDHFEYFLKNNPEYSTKCNLNEKCRNLTLNEPVQSCWGYEDDCQDNHRYKKADCEGDSKGWTKTREEQEETFFNQADFGYVKIQRKELKSFCHPMNDHSSSSEKSFCHPRSDHSSSSEKSLCHLMNGHSSSLECTKYMRFCRGSNIMIDFSNLNTIEQPMRYREDVLSDGQIGGEGCRLDKKSLIQESAHKSPLQSWFEEIEHFTVFEREEVKCDVLIEKPTFLMKLDATVNMYHHFCDFINLYLTMHINNSFEYDNNILIWDMMPYRSNFGSTWKAFTNNPIIHLGRFKGKKICFKNLVFSLPPRMIFGMYYNMPIVPGCSGSGLFHAFNRHLLHRMNIKDTFQFLEDKGKEKKNDEKGKEKKSDEKGKEKKSIRITIISRKTRFRRILNERELVGALKKKSRHFVVNVIDYSHQMPFVDQVAMTAKTDILIGIHGAGLTHCLFLPDYSLLFELYNCGDEFCYKDLARLRGIKYLTWTDLSKLYPEDEGLHPSMKGPHEKFTNYSFDVDEFLRLVSEAAKYVRLKRRQFYSKTSSGKPHDEL